MAEIVPITGGATQSTQTPKVETPGTDSIAKTSSSETVAPEQNSVDAVQESEQTESTQVGGEEEGHDAPEKESTFIGTA